MKNEHRIQDADGLWAILPSALAAHIEAEVRHLRNEGPELIERFGGVIAPAESGREGSVDVSPVTVRLGGGSASDENDLYTLLGNIAIVPISGTLTQKGTWRSPTTYGGAAQALRAAAVDPRTAAVLALVDSPGGTVAGVTDLVDAVREVGAQKPLYAYTDGTLASGAYWPMAGARVIGAVSTAQVGSIGVLLPHEDISRMLDRMGVKLTFLTSGKFKAMGNFAEPLSDEARAYMQSRIDAIYSLFTEDVAAGRSLSIDDAERWADGRVFPAAAAVDAGLVDRVESLNSFIQFIQEDIDMKPNDVKAQHPETHRAIYNEGVAAAKAEATAETDAAKKAAADQAKADAQAEFIAIVGAMFGKEAADKLAAVIKTGVTADQFAAMKAAFGQADTAGTDTANADADSRQAILAGITAATPPPVQTGGSAAQGTGGADAAAQFEAILREKQAAAMTRGLAMKTAAQEHPELNRKWIAAQQR